MINLFPEKQPSSSGPGYLPFKDMKMRKLFNNAGHNSITAIIFTISPWKSDIESSISTLRFAQTAKKIKLQAVQNEFEGNFDHAVHEDF